MIPYTDEKTQPAKYHLKIDKDLSSGKFCINFAILQRIIVCPSSCNSPFKYSGSIVADACEINTLINESAVKLNVIQYSLTSQSIVESWFSGEGLVFVLESRKRVEKNNANISAKYSRKPTLKNHSEPDKNTVNLSNSRRIDVIFLIASLKPALYPKKEANQWQSGHECKSPSQQIRTMEAVCIKDKIRFAKA